MVHSVLGSQGREKKKADTTLLGRRFSFFRDHILGIYQTSLAEVVQFSAFKDRNVSKQLQHNYQKEVKYEVCEGQAAHNCGAARRRRVWCGLGLCKGLSYSAKHR